MEKVCANPNDFSSSSGQLKCPREKKQNNGSVVLTSRPYVNEVKEMAAENGEEKTGFEEVWKSKCGKHANSEDTLRFRRSYSAKKTIETFLVCAVTSYCPFQGPGNFSFGVLSGSCWHTECAGFARMSICDEFK
jgi:hypothetical protein